jgi:DamX protein
MGAGDPGLAERLRALGLGEAEDAGDPLGTGEDPLAGPGSGPGQGLATLVSRLDNLAAGLAAQGDQLRDAERSLVDRIADVDDDRRRTQGQLQRAMQSQYDAVDGRLRRLGGLTILGLALIAALAAGGLYLLHALHQRAMGELQGDLMGELQTLGLELDRLKGTADADARLQEQVSTLSATLGRLSEDLDGARAAPAAGVPAASAEVASLSERIARLESAQREMIAETSQLREALAAASAAPPAPRAKVEAGLGERIARLESTQREMTAEIDRLRGAPAEAATAPPAPSAAETAEASAEPREAAPDAAGSAQEMDTSRETPESAEPVSEPTPPAQEPAPTADRPFALQLMGSYDRDRVLALAARPDLPASVYMRQESLRGRPWYVLIHSLHAAYEDAQAEHGRLPEDLARLDTWIRRLPPDAGLEQIPTGRAP